MKTEAKKLIKYNLLLAALLALLILLSQIPFLGQITGIFTMLAVFAFTRVFVYIPLIILLLAANTAAFFKVKKGGKCEDILLLFGSLGALIAFLFFQRKSGEKSSIYLYFSLGVWLFAIYPLAHYILLELDMLQFPSV